MSVEPKTVVLQLTPDYYFLAHDKWSLQIEDNDTDTDTESLRAFKELLAKVGVRILPWGRFLRRG